MSVDEDLVREACEDVILNDCIHPSNMIVTDTEDSPVAYCAICESYAPFWLVDNGDGPENEYGDWERRPELLKDISLEELVERAKQAKGIVCE